MKKTKHTPEPWELYGHAIHKDGECLAYLNGCSFENARRIVACVNACEGISTERLEENSVDPVAGVFGRMAARAEKETRTLTAQRDELLAALAEASVFLAKTQFDGISDEIQAENMIEKINLLIGSTHA